MASFANLNDTKSVLDSAIVSEIAGKIQDNTLKTYLDQSGADFLNDIESSKYANAGLVFNGVENSLTNQLNTYSYYTRNKDVNNLIEYPMARMRTDAQGLKMDNMNAQRQYEINQWTSGNRADTLFVYQIIFVLIMALSILTGLWRMGYISTGLLSFAVFGSIVAIVLIIVARAQYTAFQRNKRYWNKRQFPRLNIAISGSGPNCPSVSGLLDEFDYEKLKDRVRAGTADLRGSTAGYLSSLSGGINTLAGQFA